MPADYVVTCDGGSRGNGTLESQGYGSWQVEANGRVFGPYTREFGVGVTNNEAEYMALLKALAHITHYMQDEPAFTLEVRTDSQLVVGQLTQGWKIKAANLRPLAFQAKEMLARFKSYEFVKIPRAAVEAILGH